MQYIQVQKYLLVLQWSLTKTEDHDFLVETETILMEGLPSTFGYVEGHDIGSGEMNIFVLTNDPYATFEAICGIFKDSGILRDARVAFTEASESLYTVLWPTGLETFAIT